METDMFGIYQTILMNINIEIYTGDSLHDALEIAKKTGFEAVILLDGALVATYSSVDGIKFV